MFAWRDNRWMGPLRGQKMAVFAHFFEQNRPPELLSSPKYRLTPLLPIQISRWNTQTRRDIAFQSIKCVSQDIVPRSASDQV